MQKIIIAVGTPDADGPHFNDGRLATITVVRAVFTRDPGGRVDEASINFRQVNNAAREADHLSPTLKALLESVVSANGGSDRSSQLEAPWVVEVGRPADVASGSLAEVVVDHMRRSLSKPATLADLLNDPILQHFQQPIRRATVTRRPEEGASFGEATARANALAFRKQLGNAPLWTQDDAAAGTSTTLLDPDLFVRSLSWEVDIWPAWDAIAEMPAHAAGASMRALVAAFPETFGNPDIFRTHLKHRAADITNPNVVRAFLQAIDPPWAPESYHWESLELALDEAYALENEAQMEAAIELHGEACASGGDIVEFTPPDPIDPSTFAADVQALLCSARARAVLLANVQGAKVESRGSESTDPRLADAHPTQPNTSVSAKASAATRL